MSWACQNIHMHELILKNIYDNQMCVNYQILGHLFWIFLSYKWHLELETETVIVKLMNYIILNLSTFSSQTTEGQFLQ